MATSRTGTTQWKRTVRIVRHRDRHITHCKHCHAWLDWKHSLRPNSAEVDHIIPHSQGGTDTPDNAEIICRRCNQKLGAKQRTRHGNKTRSNAQIPKRVTPITSSDW